MNIQDVMGFSLVTLVCCCCFGVWLEFYTPTHHDDDESRQKTRAVKIFYPQKTSKIFFSFEMNDVVVFLFECKKM